MNRYTTLPTALRIDTCDDLLSQLREGKYANKSRLRAVCIIATALLTPLTAQAHAFLDDAMPKVGSVTTTPPRQLRLHYTQTPEPAFSHVTLVGADGRLVATGPVSADPADSQALIALVTGRMSAGRYEVKWDVISVDTHHTDGHFPFDYQP